MWETVELREIRVFLVLAEELHFGRTAERLSLTQSRVSQSLRTLEGKLGQRLVDRTSRRVNLTPAGERFREEAGGAYDQLAVVLRRTQDAGESLNGKLRLGLLSAGSGGPAMLAIIAAFESQHQGCTVETVEFPFGDRLRPLRAGELDLIATRIPLEQPDLVVGPTLSRDRRVLAVASDHPLAGRKRVSIEEVADYEVARLASLPKELSAALVPARTPTGRLIRRRREEVRDLSELLTLVARGKLVHPTVAPFGEYFAHAGIVYVPIADMPPSSSALVWRRRDPNPRLRAFVRTAKDVLRSRRGSASP